MGNKNNLNNYDLALGFLQVFDVLLNVNQVSNDVLLKELQRQNTDYLEKILQEISELNKNIKYSVDAIARQNNTIMTQNAEILEILEILKKTTD